MIVCSREERFNRILEDLMEFDELFSDFARMGRCIFNEGIRTACISYNAVGEEMGFYWNPNFFDSNSDYTNSFILCHEMLHVFLNHGTRGIGLLADKSNVMMDISINHMLVDCFGFQRSMIDNWEKLCWRDTVFNIKMTPQPSFEGYYNIEDQYINEGFNSLDEHTFLKKDNDGIARANEERTPIRLPEYFEDKVKDKLIGLPGCTREEMALLERLVEVHSVKKPKFETVVRNVAKSIIKKTKIFGATWASIDRRLTDICPDLPVVKKIEEKPKKDKYLCHFYIDNSGSCADYIARFAKCAESLNEEVFEAKVFTFDTSVYEVSKENGKYLIRGGGGTDFSCVVRHTETQKRIPDCCFVLTDGEAMPVSTRNRKIWHWLITENGNAGALRGAGRIWKLSQFE